MTNIAKRVWAAAAIGACLMAGSFMAPSGSAGATTSKTGCIGQSELGGPITLQQALELPRIVDGLNTVPAPYTVESLTEVWAIIDQNGDGLACLKSPSSTTGGSYKSWGVWYAGTDNTRPNKDG